MGTQPKGLKAAAVCDSEDELALVCVCTSLALSGAVHVRAVFAPLRRYMTRPGMSVAILGIGGLGHLGLQVGRCPVRVQRGLPLLGCRCQCTVLTVRGTGVS